jgi:hypothetical protein
MNKVGHEGTKTRSTQGSVAKILCVFRVRRGEESAWV